MNYFTFHRALTGKPVEVNAAQVSTIDPPPEGTDVGCVITVAGQRIALMEPLSRVRAALDGGKP